MKRIVIIIGLLIGATILLRAQESHRFGIQAAGGFSDMIDLKETKAHGGGKIEAGILYERRKNHFLFQLGVGADYSYLSIKNNAIIGELPDMIDDDNDVCRYLYSLDEKIDRMHRIDVIPRISMGGQWESIYFLVGLGAHVNLFTRTTTQANLTTKGEYINLIIPLEAMDNHYFLNAYPLSNKGSEKNRVYLSAHAEIGYQIPSFRYTTLQSTAPIHRIAVYVEYGLAYLGNYEKGNPIIDFGLTSNRLSDIAFDQIAIQPLVGTEKLAWKDVHPISVGVRWTMILDFPSTQRCKCNRH